AARHILWTEALGRRLFGHGGWRWRQLASDLSDEAGYAAEEGPPLLAPKVSPENVIDLLLPRELAQSGGLRCTLQYCHADDDRRRRRAIDQMSEVDAIEEIVRNRRQRADDVVPIHGALVPSEAMGRKAMGGDRRRCQGVAHNPWVTRE